MMLISHWYDWYNIDVKSWTFLEPGEAKITVDSHHASIAHAIKRYVCVGCDLKEGSDIEAAIANLGGTSVAQITPDRKKNKKAVKTLAGISNLYEWQWPKNDEHAGLVKARPLPNIGEWTYYSSTEFSKPTPETSTPTIPSSSWTMPKPYGLDPRRLKKQVLKNKLDDENVAYQEKTSRVELASRLQIHLASKENQISPILGEICATPMNEQMDLEIHRLF